MAHYVFVILGIFTLFIGVTMNIPLLVDLSIGNEDWKAFGTSAAIAIFIGASLIFSNNGTNHRLGVREGYLLTAGGWVIVSIFSALPFWLSSQNITFTNAVFETVSGLTTTGSTVLTGLDSMPPGLLLWRAMLQWIGGIGIIVMAVAALPFLRVGGMQLFQMESSDRSEKISARVADISIRILIVYIVITTICSALYIGFGMTTFEAAIHAMTTVSTGGFSTSDQSLGHFHSRSIEWTAIAFMLLGSLPFTVYVRYFRTFKLEALRKDSQVLVFLSYTAVAVLVLGSWMAVHKTVPLEDTLRVAAFNVVSVVTTTGYATTDYVQWGGFALVFFFFLTFIGGCAGSTSGGVKTFRFEVMAREVYKQLRAMPSPHAIYITSLNGRPVDASVFISIMVFFSVMIALLVGTTILLGMMGVDFLTAFSAAVTSISNVGPGLGHTIGPAGNFESLPSSAKWILDLGMITGRLEYLTVLVLLSPSFWGDLEWR